MAEHRRRGRKMASNSVPSYRVCAQAQQYSPIGARQYVPVLLTDSALNSGSNSMVMMTSMPIISSSSSAGRSSTSRPLNPPLSAQIVDANAVPYVHYVHSQTSAFVSSTLLPQGTCRYRSSNLVMPPPPTVDARGVPYTPYLGGLTTAADHRVVQPRQHRVRFAAATQTSVAEDSSAIELPRNDAVIEDDDEVVSFPSSSRRSGEKRDRRKKKRKKDRRRARARLVKLLMHLVKSMNEGSSSSSDEEEEEADDEDIHFVVGKSGKLKLLDRRRKRESQREDSASTDFERSDTPMPSDDMSSPEDLEEIQEVVTKRTRLSSPVSRDASSVPVEGNQPRTRRSSLPPNLGECSRPDVSRDSTPETVEHPCKTVDLRESSLRSLSRINTLLEKFGEDVDDDEPEVIADSDRDRREDEADDDTSTSFPAEEAILPDNGEPIEIESEDDSRDTDVQNDGSEDERTWAVLQPVVVPNSADVRESLPVNSNSSTSWHTTVDPPQASPAEDAPAAYEEVEEDDDAEAQSSESSGATSVGKPDVVTIVVTKRGVAKSQQREDDESSSSASVTLNFSVLKHENSVTPYQCGECGKSFKEMRYFKCHAVSFHSGITCKICGETFLGRFRYRKHLQTAHVKSGNSSGGEEAAQESTAETKFDAPVAVRSQEFAVRDEASSSNPVAGKKKKRKKPAAKKSAEAGENDDVKPETAPPAFSSEVHPSQAVKPIVFSCGKCTEIFPTAAKLKWHQDDKHVRSKLVCRICSVAFTHRSLLNRHYTTVHPESEFASSMGGSKCPICGKIVKNMTLHRAVHAAAKPWTCGVCGRGFAHKCNLQAHSYTHKKAEDRPFVCNLCGAGFLRQTGLNDHMAAHKSFGRGTQPRVLPLHLRKPRHTCSICDRGFFLRRNLSRHLIQHAAPPEKKHFPCTRCDRVFQNVEYLRTHMLVHSEARPFRCSGCSRTFRWRANLKAHVQRTHRPIQPDAEV